MKGFLLGLVVAAIAVGGYLSWQRYRAPVPVVGVADAGSLAPAAKKAKRRGRGAARSARTLANVGTGESEPESEPVRLSAADLRSVAQGDDLSTPDVLRLDMSNDKELPELTQDQIDEHFRAQESAILECIAHARPDPETFVPGRVTIKFRIQRIGTVRGLRVEAPSILQKGGLFGCLKGVVGRIRFPSAGTSQIVSYPFTLS
jgi:hypothetical protein